MACIFRENGNVDIQELSECDFGAFRMVCNVCVFFRFLRYSRNILMEFGEKALTFSD